MEIPFDKYYQMYNESISPLTRTTFWYNQCNEIEWIKKPMLFEILIHKKNTPFYQWFPNTELNICTNCLDRHIRNETSSINAIIYESYYLNKTIYITYKQMYQMVNKLSYILKNHNINKGDRVIIYMPMIPEGIISMLSCARIGAIHSVVFAGFAANELAERIANCNPKMIITASCGIEPKRTIPYYSIIKKAIEIANIKENIKILLFQRYDAYSTPLNEIDHSNVIIYDKESAKISDSIYVQPEPMKGSDIFFILYTSGTTGIPKGIVRDYSIIVSINFTMKYIMNLNKGDVSFSTSDIGWIVGHIFIVYGPLLRGATTTIFEGKPVNTPHSGKFWEIINKYHVKTFYTSPTALRAIKQEDPHYTKMHQYDLSSLQSVHLSGERSDPETFKWIERGLGSKVIINDQWWQTESGWPICCNNVSISPFKLPPGFAGPPMMGYKVVIMDESYTNELTTMKIGKVCIDLPMPPGFMSTLYNNVKAFVDRYITKDMKKYISGDIGCVDENGFVCILGRDDDMIKVAGHRLSTGKIEEVILKVKGVCECAVVSLRDRLKGEVPFGFIVCEKEISNSDIERIRKEAKGKVIEDIGRISAMKDVVVVDKLPKTRSGKIIRALLKDIVNKEQLYIPPTIEDKSVVTDIIKVVAKFKL